MQRRITGSLCTQTVCARNMLHLKTLGRETNLSSTIILHIERHTGREWRIHPHVHKNTPHAYFGPAQTPPWTPWPFALRKCSQHTAPPRARASLGRASNLSPIKMHHIERCTGPEWRAHAHARRNAPHACFGHAKSVPRALCSHMVLAMAPLIARAARV